MSFFDTLIWRILRFRLFNNIRPKIIRSDSYRIIGKTHFSDSTFSLVIFGSKISVEYFSKLFYNEAPKVEYIGKVSLQEAADNGSVSADLTIVESNWFFMPFLRDNGFFISPRVDFVLNLTDSVDSITNKASDGKRRRLRQVAEAGFSFEVTRDLVKLRSFYYDMYLPHMLKKHSKYALPISFSECLDLFSRGELLLVKSGEELISGCILVPQENELWEPILAVKNVDRQLTLGSYAIYYFSILVGFNRGFSRLDFGEAPPFMHDGVFQFKKGLGMWARPARGDNAQVFGLRFSKKSLFIDNFLSAHPFVFICEGNLCGIVFLRSVDDLSVNSLCILGLLSLYVITNNSKVSLKHFKVKKLSINDCMQSNINILRFLGVTCIEGKHHLYHLTR